MIKNEFFFAEWTSCLCVNRYYFRRYYPNQVDNYSVTHGRLFLYSLWPYSALDAETTGTSNLGAAAHRGIGHYYFFIAHQYPDRFDVFFYY